ncbi:unnamed protein product [Oppiella nova]|uniref:Fungal lipase-type domain-containing protein n=1 Tax=Oppiella nova TaxID=334625 RepID=A0A7R9LLG7_9ACAR|nr:unnamed protein product [Oppiella nova]CAG2164421.1 unnamed protein product [Oppiella nova]
MPMCSKCQQIRKSIANSPVVSGGGAYPSTLELAYMVNLEYYIDIKYDCVHEIPEVKGLKIPIIEMVNFIEKKKWEVGTKTSYNGFKCTSFLNRPAKQLVIVHRGTENWEQVKTDIMLAMNIVTPEVIKKADWHTRQSLMNNTLKEVNNMFVRNDYSVTVTGHSLGGWLAQMCALLSKYPQFHPYGPRGTWSFPNGKSIDMNQPYDLHCVAFDSPGAKAVLNHMQSASKTAAWLAGLNRDVGNALTTLDISVYLSNRNPVNLCGDHVGKVERISVTWFWEKLNPFASHSMERILNYFKNR